jgi:hypothetical protein
MEVTMRELLMRCLLINLAAIIASGVLVLWYRSIAASP